MNKFLTRTFQPPSRPQPRTRDMGPSPITYDRLAVHENIIELCCAGRKWLSRPESRCYCDVPPVLKKISWWKPSSKSSSNIYILIFEWGNPFPPQPLFSKNGYNASSLYRPATLWKLQPRCLIVDGLGFVEPAPPGKEKVRSPDQTLTISFQI